MSIVALPDNGPPTIALVGDDELYEVIEGKRTRTSPGSVFGVWLASEISSHVAYHARTQGIGRVLIEALFHMPAPINRDRRPDVAYVSYERWAKDRSVPRTDNAWDVVPNLAIEVVSPTDAAEDLLQKISEYFRAGVQVVWVVYPLESTIHVYQPPKQITVLLQDDVLDGGAVVPGFRLPLAGLFAEEGAEI